MTNHIPKRDTSISDVRLKKTPWSEITMHSIKYPKTVPEPPPYNVFPCLLKTLNNYPLHKMTTQKAFYSGKGFPF